MSTDAPRLLSGPYVPPRVRRRDWLDDAIDGAVQVGGYSDGPIPWPRRLKTGRHSLILCGDLVRAVRTESSVAVQHWFGVGVVTVAKWRVALGVDRQNNSGTQALYRELQPQKLTPEVVARARIAAAAPDAVERMRQAKTGKPAHAATRAALLAAAKQPKPPGWGKRASDWMRRGKETAQNQAPRPAHRRGAWTPEELAMLGTDADPAIAARLGVSLRTVFLKRSGLGIPPATVHPPRPRDTRWTADMLALLGTMTDAAVARALNITARVVQRQRVNCGIPPFARRGRWPSAAWTPEALALLGTASDAAVAAQIGLKVSAVHAKRKSLGIEARGGRGTASTNSRWPPEALALLGTTTDAAVAAQIGLTVRAVHAKRKSLGIKACDRQIAVPSPRWTPAALALLGTTIDAAVARRLGITRAAVHAKRQRLGIAAHAPKTRP